MNDTEPLSYEVLGRRIHLTSWSRYEAAKRLQRHNRWSLWTVSLLSVALIFLTVYPSLVANALSAGCITTMETCSAVLVLVYSLLLSNERYAVRGESMHQCGIELGRIVRDIEILLRQNELNTISGSQYSETINDLSNRYHNALMAYENHEHVDYVAAKSLRGDPVSRTERLIRWFTYWLGFSHYLVVAMVILWFIFITIANSSEPLTLSLPLQRDSLFEFLEHLRRQHAQCH